MQYTTFPSRCPRRHRPGPPPRAASPPRTNVNGFHRLHATIVRRQQVNEVPLFDTHLLDMNAGLDLLVSIAHKQIRATAPDFAGDPVFRDQRQTPINLTAPAVEIDDGHPDPFAARSTVAIELPRPPAPPVITATVLTSAARSANHTPEPQSGRRDRYVVPKLSRNPVVAGSLSVKLHSPESRSLLPSPRPQ